MERNLLFYLWLNNCADSKIKEELVEYLNKNGECGHAIDWAFRLKKTPKQVMINQPDGTTKQYWSWFFPQFKSRTKEQLSTLPISLSGGSREKTILFESKIDAWNYLIKAFEKPYRQKMIGKGMVKGDKKYLINDLSKLDTTLPDGSKKMVIMTSCASSVDDENLVQKLLIEGIEEITQGRDFILIHPNSLSLIDKVSRRLYRAKGKDFVVSRDKKKYRSGESSSLKTNEKVVKASDALIMISDGKSQLQKKIREFAEESGIPIWERVV